MTTRRPPTNAGATTPEPATGQRKTPRKQGPDKWHIYLEPEDADGEPEYQQSIHGDRDPATFVERSDDFEAGVYLCVKTRSNGQRLTSFSHTKVDRPETDLEDFDETEGLESPAPAFQQSGADDEHIRRLVSASVKAALDERDRRERGDRERPSVIDYMREAREETERVIKQERERQAEIDARIERIIQREKRGGADQSNPLEFAQKIFESAAGMYRSIGKLAPGGNVQPTTFDRAMEVTDRVLEHVPKLLPLFLRAMQMSAAAKSGQPPPPEQQATPLTELMPSPAQESEAETPFTFDDMVENIKIDILEGNQPRDTINDVLRLAAEHPELLPVVVDMMSTPNDVLLARLSEATSTNLSLLANASKYIDGLKKGVHSRLQLATQAAPVSVTSNGNKSGAVVTE